MQSLPWPHRWWVAQWQAKKERIVTDDWEDDFDVRALAFRLEWETWSTNEAIHTPLALCVCSYTIGLESGKGRYRRCVQCTCTCFFLCAMLLNDVHLHTDKSKIIQQISSKQTSLYQMPTRTIIFIVLFFVLVHRYLLPDCFCFFFVDVQHHLAFYRQESSSRLWLIKVHFGPSFLLRIVLLHDEANSIVAQAHTKMSWRCVRVRALFLSRPFSLFAFLLLISVQWLLLLLWWWYCWGSVILGTWENWWDRFGNWTYNIWTRTIACDFAAIKLLWHRLLCCDYIHFISCVLVCVTMHINLH